MRMNKIPRGVQNPMEGGPGNFNLVAEPIELGAGGQDVHAQHGQQTPMSEAEWFQRAEQMPADPRYAPSYMHGPQPQSQFNPRPRTEMQHVTDGVVVGAFMQKDGAHLEVAAMDGTKFALFCEDTPLVRLGLKVRVSEKVTYDTTTGDVMRSEIVVEDVDA